MSEATFVRRTYLLGIINGALFSAFSALTDPGTVTAALIQAAVASPIAVGLAVGANGVGWNWPSLLVANRIESRTYKMPYYRVAAVGRWTTVALMTALIVPLARYSRSLLAAMIILGFFIYSSWGGMGILAFNDVVARHVPPTRRGAFWAWRNILGGVLGFLAGMFVRFILTPSRSGFAFPVNFTVIYAVAFLFNVAGLGAFCMVRETPGAAARRIPLSLQMALGPRLLRRDANYRRLLALRVCSQFARGALPLFVPFAISQLHVPDSAVGTYVSISVVFSLSATFLWGRMSDLRGNRRVLLRGSAALVLAPAIALALGCVPDTSVAFLGMKSLRQALFPLVFAASGFAAQGVGIGDTNYLFEIAPPRRRISYFGFLNVATIPLFAIPALAGALAGVSYYLVFAISTAAALLGVAVAASLEEPRERLEPTPGGRK